MRTAYVLAVAILLAAGSASAQTAPADLRVVDVTVRPDPPAFAEPLEVRITLRVRSGFTLVLPDSLSQTEAIEGTGSVGWTTSAAPGDSIDIVASYPAVAFLDGRAALPDLRLGIVRAVDGAGGPAVVVHARSPREGAGAEPDAAARAGAGGDGPAAEWLLRLGAIDVAPYPPMEEESAVLVPRPPADVIGREWSVWLALAVGFAATLGFGGAGLMIPRWWSGRGATVLARLRGRSPRRDALRELEWIRSAGMHRNGRVDDFYASTTETIRRYAEQVDADCVGALTSTELIALMAARWGPGVAAPLLDVIETAERVKFGTLRPAPETAERDWTTIRDWVRAGPGRR